MTKSEKMKGRIFILDDDRLVVMMLGRALRNAGYKIMEDTSAEGALDKIRAFSPDIVMLDINIAGHSGLDILSLIKEEGILAQVVMLTSDNSAETAVKSMKLGAADYLTKPFNMDEVKIVVESMIKRGALEREVEHLRGIACRAFDREIVGESDPMLRLKNDILKIANARVQGLLITGESGTGKELIARRVYYEIFGHCATACEPFIAINCAALPENLVESELFGHEKGAFTDAKSDKKGFFELADGGVVLLDEIGEMRLDLQSKLLRALEERVIRRIGGKAEIPVNVIVIATTNKDLEESVKDGSFRKDLYFRLNTFHVAVPALRDRKSDIILLAERFLSDYSLKYNNRTIKRFSKDAEDILLNYSWPGNVRELKNIIERIVVLERSEVITPEQLPERLNNSVASVFYPNNNNFILPDEGISLEELEKNLIIQAISKANGNKTLASRLLGISYDTLRYQVKRFNL